MRLASPTIDENDENDNREAGSNGGRNISMRRFYAYHQFMRRTVPPNFNVLHASGSLFQLYTVLSYLKVEKSQLEYLRYNQTRLRSEKYSVLKNFVRIQGDQNVRIGRQIILAPAFQGSP